MAWIRRLALLGALVGIGVVVATQRSRRRPQPRPRPVVADRPPAAPEPPPRNGAAWVEPVDGACPVGHPVKVGASGIYHVPGGRFYDRTRPQRCYVDATAAEADGYRAAKGS